MKKILLSLILIMSILFLGKAQVGIGTSTPNPNSILDLNALDKGLLLPRLTTSQRTAMTLNSSDDKGLKVFDTDTNSFWYWNGVVWVNISSNNIYNSDGTLTGNRTVSQGTNTVSFTSSATTGTNHFSIDGSTFSVDAANNRVGVGITNPNAILDVSGTTGGMLIPRMTETQMNNIVSPGLSTLVFNTTRNAFYYYTGFQWDPLVSIPVTSKILTMVKKSSNQTFASGSTSGDITWDIINGQQSSQVSLSGSSITLPAGKTFKITGYLGIATASNSASSWAVYEIVNAFTNNQTGFTIASRGFSEPSTEVMNDSGGGPALAIITTGVSPISIKMRITNKRSDVNVVTTSQADPFAETVILIEEL